MTAEIGFEDGTTKTYHSRWYGMCEDFLSTMVEYMFLEERVPSVERIFVQPGNEVAWDADCKGQMWVRLASAEPLVSPQEDSGVGPDPLCTFTGWRYTLGLGILVCVSTLDDRGQAPSDDDLSSDAFNVLLGAENIFKAVLCDNNLRDKYSIRFSSMETIGPMGAFAGAEFTVTVTVTVG